LSTQAYAQDFTGVISFGDSLSDAGNVARLNGLPAGNSFTTNPDPVAAQIIAAFYGFNQTNISPLIPGSNGTNYAYGGACSQANSATFTCALSPASFSVTNQVTGHLAANGGRANSNALYTIWAGANDIFTAAGNPATAATVTTNGAINTVGLVRTLQNAGANYILVFNLPDIGLTPQFRGTASSASITQLSNVYNGVLNSGLATARDGIVPINVYGIFNDIIANPGLYGFTNVTGIACGPGAPGVVSSVACGPVGSGLPFTYAPGTNETFAFADGVHPSGASHRILANVVYATLEAPQLLSTVPENSLQTYEDHSSVLNAVIWHGRKAERADNDLQGYAQITTGQFETDTGASAPNLDGDHNTVTIGGDYRFNEKYSGGVAISLGSVNSGSVVGGNDAQNNLITVYGVRNFGEGGYVNAALSGGSGTNRVQRYNYMGPNRRIDQGDAGSNHYGVELGAGYVMGEGGGFQHGPFARVTWQRVEVEAYDENSSSTAMRFYDFERESLLLSVGYGLAGQFEWGSKTVSPYLRVSYTNEQEDEATAVRAGSVNLNGTFTRAGFTPSEDYFNANLGIVVGLTEKVDLSLGAQGRFGDDQQDDVGGMIGLSIDL
jgi:outer membrane lipase/esterase